MIRLHLSFGSITLIDLELFTQGDDEDTYGKLT